MNLISYPYNELHSRVATKHMPIVPLPPIFPCIKSPYKKIQDAMSFMSRLHRNSTVFKVLHVLQILRPSLRERVQTFLRCPERASVSPQDFHACNDVGQCPRNPCLRPPPMLNYLHTPLLLGTARFSTNKTPTIRFRQSDPIRHAPV